MLKTDLNTGWFCREIPGGSPYEVTLPHDASIRKRRTADEKSGSAGGYFPTVDLEYTKEFTLPEGVRHAWIRFDGAYQNAEVYMDGVPVAREPHGYIPFLAPIETGGREETHRVRVTLASGAAPNSRWYAGCGIYREVCLLTGGEVCIDPQGAKITPISDGEASRVEVSAGIIGSVGPDLTATIDILDGAGTVAATASAAVEGGQVNCTLPLAYPHLWSCSDPTLYRCILTLYKNNEQVDTVISRFGFRSIRLDREKGFLLNGVPLKLRGGCVHHDNGLLGAAAWPDAERRKVRLLAQNGFNAVRTAHNPPSTAFLDACDEAGILVIDEFTDMWNWGKNLYDYHLHFAAWWKKDLAAMLARDYNHPSVVFWSIGNEIPERDGSLGGYEITRKMCSFIRSIDPTRFITAGLNNISPRRAQMLEANLARDSAETDCFDLKSRETLAPLDAAGYNYMFRRYGKDLAKYPERFIIGTESVAQEVRENEAAVQSHPRVLGDFLWSAIDYLGEAGLGSIRADGTVTGYFEGYPWRLANCGDLDITGWKRPQSYLRDAVWGRLDKPYICVQPPWRYDSDGQLAYWAFPERCSCWDFPKYVGQRLRVFVYSDAVSITLKLNGKTVGQQKVESFEAAFELTYESGVLEATDDRGRTAAIRTPEGKPALQLISDRQAFRQEGELAYIDILLASKNTDRNRFTEEKVNVRITGGKLLALGTASPTSEESFDTHSVTLFDGRAQAIVQCDGREAQIHVLSEYGEEASLRLPWHPMTP